MNVAMYAPMFFLLFIILLQQKHERESVMRRIKTRRKKRNEGIDMNEIITRYIGKDCVIYTSNGSQHLGKVKEVLSGWLTFENEAGAIEALNIDYITRIKEHPLNKNGKKKQIVF